MRVVQRGLSCLVTLGIIAGCGKTSSPSAPESGDECDAIADELAREMEPGYCTAVLRFAFETSEPLGHAFVCAPVNSSPSEGQARERANAEVIYDMQPEIKAGEGELAGGAGPASIWAFVESPLDVGGVAVVSAVTGEPVFGGSILWIGVGKIEVPDQWSTADLGSGCTRSGSPLPITTINLGLDSMIGQFDSTAVRVLSLTSALPQIWRRWGGDLDRVALLVYPRFVGAFAPSEAEYVVFLEGHSAGG